MISAFSLVPFPGASFRAAEPATQAPELLGRMGPLVTRLARSPDEVREAQRLRHRVFYGEMNAKADLATRLLRRDRDAFDRFCDHLLVLDTNLPKGKRVVATYRVLDEEGARKAGHFYTETEFDLSHLRAHHAGKRFLELGRSCVDPAYRSRRTLELMWQGIWALVQRRRSDILFGCASFPSTDPSRFSPALGWLSAHAALGVETPCAPVSADCLPLAACSAQPANLRAGLGDLPPLLKGYLRVGAKVGSHAVFDRQFGTTDVLVVLDVATINPRYVSHYGSNATRFAA